MRLLIRNPDLLKLQAHSGSFTIKPKEISSTSEDVKPSLSASTQKVDIKKEHNLSEIKNESDNSEQTAVAAPTLKYNTSTSTLPKVEQMLVEPMLVEPEDDSEPILHLVNINFIVMISYDNYFCI